MYRLFQLATKYRNFLLFLAFEAICIFFLSFGRSSDYQKAILVNSSNNVIGSFLEVDQNVKSYLSLQEINGQLMEENIRLRLELENVRNQTANKFVPGIISQVDSLPYEYIPCYVINNSSVMVKNTFTINKGSNHGIEPGMGVVTSKGIAGQVRNVSSNFSVVNSFLHSSMLVSSKVRNSNLHCTSKWGTNNPKYGTLEYVPRFVKVNKGDTIITSGYNAVFPEGMLIGKINNAELSDTDPYFDIKIDLFTDFKALYHVYVIKNKAKVEIDSLNIENSL